MPPVLLQLLLPTLLVITSCQGAMPAQDSADGAPGIDAASSHDAYGSDAAPAPATWTVVETTTDDGAIIIEKIVYPSGSLDIYGQVCRPAATGPFPAIIINHGGWVGLGNEWNGGACANLARNGYVVLQSSYRGEDGSDGDIEICGGEVDDVLALLELAQLRTDLIDADRVAMWGGSHGGCITLRAVARDPELVAAVAAVPPIDLVTLHAYWKEGLEDAPSSTEELVWTSLSSAVEQALGGTPDEVPSLYEERSPIRYMSDIVASGIPVMIIHGGADYFVPPQQGCVLAAAAFESRYVIDASGTVSESAPEHCSDQPLEWNTNPRPVGQWPESLYLQVYSDMGHGFEGTTGPVGLLDTLDFLETRLD